VGICSRQSKRSIQPTTIDGDHRAHEIASDRGGSRAHPTRTCVGVATLRSTPAYTDGGGRLCDASRRRLAVGDATSARQDRTVDLCEEAGVMPVSLRAASRGEARDEKKERPPRMPRVVAAAWR